MQATQINNVLHSLYYDPKKPSGYASVQKLYDAAKSKIGNLHKTTVKEWLSSQLTYTLHKQARRRFKRNPIIVSEIDEQWEADLIDMQEFTKFNDGYKYLITIVDSFSRFGWAIPIKNKSGPVVFKALEDLFEKRYPEVFRTDKGREFNNKHVQKLLKNYRVRYFMAQNMDIKCAMVERFNRTLKNKMFRYFTAKGTRRYVDVINDLMKSYNSSIHRTTKFAPDKVSRINQKQVFKNIYGFESLRDMLKKQTNLEKNLKIGDKVRIKYKLGPFDKSFYPNWTDQVYTITEVDGSKDKVLVKLKTEDGQVLDKKFYAEEVQKINSTIYRIEKIINRRVRNRNVEILVKWLGYPEKYNSWIPISNLVDLTDN